MQKIKITKFNKKFTHHRLKSKDQDVFLLNTVNEKSRTLLEMLVSGNKDEDSIILFVNDKDIEYKVIVNTELEDLKKENNILNNDNRNLSEDIQVFKNVISRLEDDLKQVEDSRDEYRDWMCDLEEDLDKNHKDYGFLWDSRLEIADESKKKDAIITEQEKSLENQKQIIKLLSQEL